MDSRPDPFNPEHAVFTEVAECLLAAGGELTPRELAEAAWLARFFPTGQRQVGKDPRVGLDSGPQLVKPGQEGSPADDTGTEESNVPTASETGSPKAPDDHAKVPPPPAPITRPVYAGQPSGEVSPHQVRAAAFRSPTGRAVPAARALAGALRFLQRRVPDPAITLIDEAATVDRWAEQRLHHPHRRAVLPPVTQPGSRRAWEIALLVDTAPSMAVWQEVARELAEMLSWQGAFRDVRVWALDTSDPQRVPGIRPWSRGAPGTEMADRHPSELLTARGDRLLVVLTDGTAPAWTDGLALDLLADWGRAAPVAVWQVLPERLWGQTAFGTPRWLATAREPGLTNAGWTVAPRPGEWDTHWEEVDDSAGAEEELRAAVPVPVLPLDSKALVRWARAVAGLGRAWVPAVRVLPERSVLRDPIRPTVPAAAGEDHTAVKAAERRGAEEISGQERLRRFIECRPSPIALRLARMLAHVPLTVPVMRLVQSALLPQSDQSHLAEFLLSGLVYQPVAGPERKVDPEAFEFHPGVQELLAALTLRSDALQALVEVGRYLELSDETLARFDAYVGDNPPKTGEGEEFDARLKPYAYLRRQALERFGLLPSRAPKTLGQTEEPPKSGPPEELTVPVTLESRLELQGHASITGRLAWSPVHRCLGGAYQDGTVRIWDPEDGRTLFETAAHSGAAYALAWSPAEPLLVSGGSDRRLRFWSPTQQTSYALSYPEGTRIYDLAWSPDGRWLLVTGSRHLLEVLALPPPGDRSLLDARVHQIRSEHLAWGSVPATLFTGAWSADGKYIAAGGRRRHGTPIRLWRWQGERAEPMGELVGHQDWITHLAWSPREATHLASASWDHSVKVWDVATREPIVTLTGHSAPVIAVNWSPDGRTLATRSADGTFRLWDPTTGQQLLERSIHTPKESYYWPAALAFHPQTPALATAEDDQRRVQVWSLGDFAGPIPGAAAREWVTGSGSIQTEPMLTEEEIRILSELLSRHPRWTNAAQRREFLHSLLFGATGGDRLLSRMALEGAPIDAAVEAILAFLQTCEVEVDSKALEVLIHNLALRVEKADERLWLLELADRFRSGVRLIVFHTDRQTTELVAERGRLQLFLHDQKSNQNSLQWSLETETLTGILARGQVKVELQSSYGDCGRFSLGSMENWLYHHRLFPTPDALREALLRLIRYAVEGEEASADAPLTETAPAMPAGRSIRILIAGSDPGDEPVAFQRACRDLGTAFAERGHALAISSWSRGTADRHVLEGANLATGRLTPVACRLSPKNDIPQELREQWRNVALTVETVPGSLRERHELQLESAEVVLAIGGGEHTRWITDAATTIRFWKPVVAVGSFGGAASEAWQSLRETYLSHGADPEDVAALGERWTERTAHAAVRLAEALVGGSRSVS